MIAAVVVAVVALSHVPQARPLSLSDATAIAVGVDPGRDRLAIEQERARLRTLRANLARVRASVDLNAQAIYVSPGFFTPSLQAPYGGVLALGTAQAAVNAPLFSGFRISNDIEAAERFEEASAFDLRAERQAVAVAVARAWWGSRRLALLQETLRGAEERLAEAERLVIARVNAGLGAGLDVNRAATRRVQLDVERQNLEAQRREADVRLALLLGIDDDILLVDDAPVPGAGADTGEDIDDLVTRALSARPELRAADLRTLALRNEEQSVASAYWPQLDAFGLVQLGNNPALPGADARAINPVFVDGNLQTGLVFRMNLFDTFTTTHAVEDVVHRQRIAAADRRALARDVETNVRLAHARVQSLRAQRNGLVRARDIVGDNLSILEKAWTRGEVLFTEVLDAQVELSQAERQIVDVDAQLVLAGIELGAVVGSDANTPGAAGKTGNAGNTGTTGTAGGAP